MIRDMVYNPSTEPALILVYEDADVLVFSKQPGLLTVAGKSPDLADCLETRVKDAYPEALLVHRLDMETSGLCIFARNALSQKGLGRQFEPEISKSRDLSVDVLAAAGSWAVTGVAMADSCCGASATVVSTDAED